MKKEAGNKIMLGVFVTLGIALFIFAIYYIGQKQRIFGSTIQISGIYKNVNGLQVGNNIRYSGINIGTVETIELISDTTARVDMMIDKSAKKFIKKDAIALIGSEGLMGNKVVNILPGSIEAKEIQNKDIIQTASAGDMDQIMSKVNLIMTDVGAIITNVREGKGTIGKLFMDSVFAEGVDQTLGSAKSAAKGMDENMEAAKKNFLLKGYFKKKEKAKERAEEEQKAIEEKK